MKGEQAAAWYTPVNPLVAGKCELGVRPSQHRLLSAGPMAKIACHRLGSSLAVVLLTS